MMRKDLFRNAIISLFCAHAAHYGAFAQTVDTQTLKTLAGFQPTVLSSEYEAEYLYDRLNTRNLKMNSGCFQRAHLWAYDLFRNSGIKSMKIFLFFTRRYQREFDYRWDYHVAPLVPVRMNDGSTQELVFDPTFTTPPPNASPERKLRFDQKPITIEKWLRYFISPHIECPLIENYSDYYNFHEKHYCYIMKAPMYNYIPENFDDDQTGETGSLSTQDTAWFDKNTRVRSGWRPGDLDQMKRALKK